MGGHGHHLQHLGDARGRASRPCISASPSPVLQAMGLQVLTIADSASRWAGDAVSDRMEDPGKPFPCTSIRHPEHSSGRGVRRRDSAVSSLTLIGTVSPAGGNEGRSQSTPGAASISRAVGTAYRRAYPAIDPLQSWSRYRDQLVRGSMHISAARNTRIWRCRTCCGARRYGRASDEVAGGGSASRTTS
jgi:vacuolar-type H+-ATPase catalytic subunit A/Vma1